MFPRVKKPTKAYLKSYEFLWWCTPSLVCLWWVLNGRLPLDVPIPQRKRLGVYLPQHLIFFSNTERGEVARYSTCRLQSKHCHTGFDGLYPNELSTCTFRLSKVHKFCIGKMEGISICGNFWNKKLRFVLWFNHALIFLEMCSTLSHSA